MCKIILLPNKLYYLADVLNAVTQQANMDIMKYVQYEMSLDVQWEYSPASVCSNYVAIIYSMCLSIVPVMLYSGHLSFLYID